MDRSRPYRELTPAAVVGGVLLGAVLNMGICFAGLQIGFTIVGSAVAAVLGFGVLRGLLNRGTILEVNVFQTVASAVNTVNAGIIFTIPVLFLLGLEGEMHLPSLILATIAGSILGTVMIIPLRKQIIEYERLRFPEGTAVAAILRSPGAGVRKSRLLIGGILVSGVITLLTKIPTASGTVVPEHFDVGSWIGVPAVFSLIFATSTLSLGAGFIAGRGGLVVLYGTLLNYWVLVPAAVWLGWLPQGLPESMAAVYEGDLMAVQHGDEAATFLGKFSHFTSRHVGIGMILGGAVAGILVALPALKAALSSLRAGSAKGGEAGDREEMPMSVINGGTIFGLALLLFAIKFSGAVGWGAAIACTLAGGAWLWLAGLVVAQTTGRTDWSPLSGLALIAIAIMMGILGTGREMIVPAVTIGAAICVATSMCADMMADFKTGYLVGSRPYRQQVAQIGIAWLGPAIALATVFLLWKAYAFGPDQAEILYQRAAKDPATLEQYEANGGTSENLAKGVPQLKAPQAGALQAAINIVQSGDVPLGKYATGAAIGLLVSLLVSPGIGVMVGLSLYLPFEYMIVFGIGGLLSIFFARRKGAHWVEDTGLPVAAGLIVGDALVNIGDAVVKVATSV